MLFFLQFGQENLVCVLTECPTKENLVLLHIIDWVTAPASEMKLDPTNVIQQHSISDLGFTYNYD